ncbi:MAG: sulfoxide reductase heme-binding subunit YedZ [Acidobacteriaceae bacterium]|nr:sulfoxide reductase heme-binding subunit YedZ [Acidobacteriaceae bacterium]
MHTIVDAMQAVQPKTRSRSVWASPWLKALVLLLCLTPLFVLAWWWWNQQLGWNRVEYVARYTGIWTLRFLLLTLAITPLRRVPGLGNLIRFRRLLGLVTFFYATLHGLHYFAIDIQWNWPVLKEDLTIRRFFIAGFAAWLLMVPLAGTSFNAAIRWLGGRRWQWLHRLVYVSAALGVIHYLWQGKSIVITPVVYGAVLLFLLMTRVVFFLEKQRT